MVDIEQPPELSVYAELVVVDPTVPSQPQPARPLDDKHVSLIGHVARAGADTTLCHLSLIRLHRCPELAFSPRPTGMQRCPRCLTAYALLPTANHSPDDH